MTESQTDSCDECIRRTCSGDTFLLQFYGGMFRANSSPRVEIMYVREFTPPYVSIHILLSVSTIQCWQSPSSVGIHRRVLAFIVQCWYSPSSVGIHRPMLALTGQCWHSPSIVGIHRPVLAFTIRWGAVSQIGRTYRTFHAATLPFFKIKCISL